MPELRRDIRDLGNLPGRAPVREEGEAGDPDLGRALPPTVNGIAACRRKAG